MLKPVLEKPVTSRVVLKRRKEADIDAACTVCQAPSWLRMLFLRNLQQLQEAGIISLIDWSVQRRKLSAVAGPVR